MDSQINVALYFCYGCNARRRYTEREAVSGFCGYCQRKIINEGIGEIRERPT